MPNSNRPQGLIPLSRSFSGGAIQTTLHRKAAGYGVRIRAFDVVNRVASGDIERSITPGTTLISGVSLTFGAASTATEHIVIEDPGQLYVAQPNGAGLAATDAGINANIVLGTTLVDRSDDQINASALGTEATRDLKVHQLLADPDNTWGQWAKIIVSINSHRLNAGVVGV